MSVEIPENMEEVAMQLAQHQVRGEQVDEKAVIQNAVRDILQAFFDEALEGHYDDVKWDGVSRRWLSLCSSQNALTTLPPL